MIYFKALILAGLLCFNPITSALINPIIPGFNPDPSLLHVPSVGYFVATSTFEHFPGVPIYHSTDLVNWSLVSHALSRPSQLTLYGTPPDAGVWAPALRYHQGSYYLATTTRYVYTPELRTVPRSFYVKTDDPFKSDWSDPIYFDGLGYDADLFWDDDGSVYYTYSGINNPIDKLYGIYQQKVDLATGDGLTPAALIYNGTLPVNSTARPEGPHVYKVGTYYYLLIAEGGTGVTHRATIARSSTPSGPWEMDPANPLVYNGANASAEVQNTGHADFAQGDDGSWWGVCLGVRPQNGNRSRAQLGRETFLFPVTWEDSWPVFNNRQPITQHTPDLFDLPPKPFHDTFASPNLDLGYYNIRTPQKLFSKIEDGKLKLKSSAYALGDRDGPNALLRKITTYTELWEAVLNFKPQSNYTEAGVTVFYSDFYHNEIAVTGCPGDVAAPRCIRSRTITGNTATGYPLTTANYTLSDISYFPLSTANSLVQLAIAGEPEAFSFGYREAANGSGMDGFSGKEYTWVAQVDSGWLSTMPRSWSYFKGAQWGIYNTANFRTSSAVAEFWDIKQTPNVMKT